MRCLLILSLMLTGLLSCTSQSKPATVDIPARSQAAFTQRFPSAAGINWRPEGELFIVTFEVDHSAYEAWIDSSGTILRLQHEIPESTLSAPVKAAISRDFADHSVGKTCQLEYTGIQAYLVTLVKDGARTDIVFLPNGSVIDTK